MECPYMDSTGPPTHVLEFYVRNIDVWNSGRMKYRISSNSLLAVYSFVLPVFILRGQFEGVLYLRARFNSTDQHCSSANLGPRPSHMRNSLTCAMNRNFKLVRP